MRDRRAFAVQANSGGFVGSGIDQKSVEGRDTFFPLRVREPAAISEAALGAAVIRIYSS